MIPFCFLISDLSDSDAAPVGGVNAWQLTSSLPREKNIPTYYKRRSLSHYNCDCIRICIFHVID